MKKSLTTTLVAAAIATLAGMPVWAQNIAIVNGKAVPTSRVEALAQQVGARCGSAGQPDRHVALPGHQLRDRDEADQPIADVRVGLPVRWHGALIPTTVTELRLLDALDASSTAQLMGDLPHPL